MSLLPLAAWEPVFAENGRNEDAGVVVTNNDGFLKALREKKSPVIIQGIVTVANGAEASGRMRPIMIPAGTVIRGGNAESILCTRAPLQIEGDGVTIEDLTIQFESSNALGSVVHREIYLAGHSLTLDHVATYLEGNGGSFGDLGGTERTFADGICRRVSRYKRFRERFFDGAKYRAGQPERKQYIPGDLYGA